MKFFSNIIVIAVIIIFVYILTSLLLRDLKNKKMRNSIISGGEKADGIITGVYSHPGEHFRLINITLHYSYTTEDGREMDGKSNAVIDKMNIHKYQPGEKLNVYYLKKEPQKVVVDIPNPLFKKN